MIRRNNSKNTPRNDGFDQKVAGDSAIYVNEFSQQNRKTTARTIRNDAIRQ